MRSRLAAAVVLTVAVLGAQGPDGQGPEGSDPPSRVARLNWMQGQVSFQPASVDTWTAATLNYPLTTGDHIYTDVDSRAEMRIGQNAIRLNSQSNFGFLNLDDRTVQIRFTGGAMEARIRFVDDEELYEVDTPNGAISLLRNGDYRIDTDPDRNGTLVTVFAGEAEITVNGQSFALHPRETGWFADGASPDIRGLNQPDDFDRFTAERNRREDTLPPPRHVNPQMIGGEDLDASLLQMVRLRFLPAGDPMLRSTIDAIHKDLSMGGWLQRYSLNDGFGKPSVAFVICTFWLIEALSAVGRRDEANEFFDRIHGALSHLGLLSEDFDPVEPRMWGNFPQTYSHVGLINAAFAASPQWTEVL